MVIARTRVRPSPAATTPMAVALRPNSASVLENVPTAPAAPTATMMTAAALSTER